MKVVVIINKQALNIYNSTMHTQDLDRAQNQVSRSQSFKRYSNRNTIHKPHTQCIIDPNPKHQTLNPFLSPSPHPLLTSLHLPLHRMVPRPGHLGFKIQIHQLPLLALPLPIGIPVEDQLIAPRIPHFGRGV